jgi:hypothetical protein
MLIIGISGKKQSGKSTAAVILSKLLQEKFATATEIVCFADKLKEIVIECFVPNEWGWTIKDLESDENKNRMLPCNKTVRQMLQIVGTDWFREVFSDCWVNAYAKKLQELYVDIIITPDVRFRNELKYIQEHNGLVIRLTKAPFVDIDKHTSETALDGVAEYTRYLLMQSGCALNSYATMAWGGALKSRVFDVYFNNEKMPMDEKDCWLQHLVDNHFG